jgi:hypothetical protein
MRECGGSMAQTSAPHARSGRPSMRNRTTRRDRPQQTTGVNTHGRAPVRWERLGRLAMLCVLGALLYLYLSAGIRMFSTWRQAHSDSAAVVAMEREHEKLVLQHQALGRSGTVEAEARRLGMMNKGEQQYVISGLPNN